MKILEAPLMAFLIRWTIVAIVLVITILILEGTYGYIFVITGPQAAIFSPGHIQIHSDEIVINNVVITKAAEWLQPHGVSVNRFFEQPKEIYIEYDTKPAPYLDGAVFTVKINLEELNKYKSSQKEIQANISKIIKIWLSSHDEKGQLENFGGEICSDAKYIDVVFLPENFNESNAYFSVEEFKQGKKTMKLKSIIEISALPLFLSQGKEKPCNEPENLNKDFRRITLSIKKLVVDIDSPIIYEWSNKAGRTWRL